MEYFDVSDLGFPCRGATRTGYLGSKVAYQPDERAHAETTKEVEFPTGNMVLCVFSWSPEHQDVRAGRHFWPESSFVIRRCGRVGSAVFRAVQTTLHEGPHPACLVFVDLKALMAGLCGSWLLLA